MSNPLFKDWALYADFGKHAEAKNASEFYMKIPEAIGVLGEYTRKVLDNECELSDLIFKTGLRREWNPFISGSELRIKSPPIERKIQLLIIIY